MKKILFCAVAALLFSGCGKSEQAASVQPVPGKTLPVASPKVTPSSLKIMGLYLGMDVASVPSAMMGILAERQLSDFSFTDPMRAGDGMQCVLMYTKPFLRAIDARMHERYGEARAQAKLDEEILSSCLNSDGVLVAKSGADNRVSRIEFNDIKDIFNADKMTPADFARKLSSDFHIPEMKPDGSGNSWSHTEPDGSKVTLESKEVLGIPMMKLIMSRQSS